MRKKTCGGRSNSTVSAGTYRKKLLQWGIKTEKITLRVEPSRLVATTAVTVGFNFETNPWIIDALESGSTLVSSDKFDSTLVAYSAYQVAFEKLTSSLAAGTKNQALEMRCGAQSGEFIISAVCASKESYVKRCAGTIIKCLNFKTLWSRYSNLCRLLDVTASKSGFHWAAREANKKLNQGITVIISGNTKFIDKGTKKNQVQKIADALEKKIHDSSPTSEGKRREVSASEAGIERGPGECCSSAPATSLEGVIVHNYVESHLKMVAVGLWDGYLWFPKIKERSVRTIINDHQIEKYAEKLSDFDDEISGMLVYLAARKCLLPTSQMKISGKFSKTEIIKAIHKTLK